MARHGSALFGKHAATVAVGTLAGRQFFAWWFGELRELLPNAAAHHPFGSGGGTSVYPRGDDLYVSTASGSEPQLLAKDGQLADTALLEELRKRENPALLIAEASVLRQVVALPAAAASKARAAIGFMLDRLTPFPAEEIYYAVRVGERDRTRNSVRAELIATPKRLVDPHVDWLRANGVAVGKVLLQSDVVRQAIEFDVPNARGGGSNSWLAQAWKPVLAAALLILALGPAAILMALQSQAVTLAEQANALAIRAKEAPDLQKQIETLTAQVRTFSSRANAPSASTILERLTALTPDDSWMFSIDVGDKGVTAQGLSRDVPALVSHLNAPPFTTPELVGAIVHGQSEGKDRFGLHIPLGSASP